MQSLVPQTELDAVNHILENLGEAPVDTLEDDLPLDALKARRKLDSIKQQVLTRGWFFNTERRLLPPNQDGFILLPLGTLSVRTVNRVGYRLTKRGDRLYRIQPDNNGPLFEKAETVDLVLNIPFEDVPPSGRFFITRRAAKEYQAQELSDQTIIQQNDLEEARAWADLVAEDNRNAQRNLGSSRKLQMILGPNRRRY